MPELTTTAAVTADEGLTASVIGKLDIGQIAKAVADQMNMGELLRAAFAEHMKGASNAPSAQFLALNGADPNEKIEKGVLVAEYYRHKLLGPGYAWRPTAVALETVVKSLGGMITRDLMTKAALTTVSAAAGAELVATDFMRDVILQAQNIVPFKDWVFKLNMTEDKVDWPKMDNTYTANYKAEAVAATPSQATTGNVLLVAKTLIALTDPISREVAADSRFPLIQTVGAMLSQKIQLKEQFVWCQGNGTTQPQGWCDGFGGGIETIDIAGSEMGYDDVIRLKHSVPVAYRKMPNVAFVGNDATRAKVELIKDDNGRPLYVEAMNPGKELDSLAGFPFLEIDEVPGDGDAESTATQLGFGCWTQGYYWGDRQVLEVESSTQGTDFDQHTIRVKAVTRNDGEIANADALRILTGIV